MKRKSINQKTITIVAKLAALKIEPNKQKYFAKQFNDTLQVIDLLQTLNTSGVPPTSQVTGITNSMRDDVVEKKRMLTQESALANAKRTHKGYFLVEAVFDE